MKCENIKDIVLTPEENNVFKLFKKKDRVFLTTEQYNTLLLSGLIKPGIGGKTSWFDDVNDGYCEISDLGKKFRQFQKMNFIDTLLKSFLCPIAVSFITTLITILISKYLA